jgi:hypothetical protein
MRTVSLRALLAPFCLASPALAQGADQCSMAQPIAGTGTFAFSSVGATTGAEGQAEPSCLFVGSTAIYNDVWFTWNATFTGVARLETCSLATFDTKAAAYAGTSCPPGAALGCNDDACALQTRLQWQVTMGQDYLIQLGSFSTTVTGSGSFTLQQYVPITGDDCLAAVTISGTGTFPFSNVGASTGTEGQGFPACGTINNDIWFRWNAPFTGTAILETCSLASFDTEVGAFSGITCPPTASLGCNDDACALQSRITFAVTLGQDYLIQIGSFSTGVTGSGSFSLVQQLPPAVVDTRVNPANGRTYHLLSTGSWTESEQVAIALGGHLATIDDQAEHDWIAAQWHNWQGVDLHLWIGLTDVATEGTWVWADGTPLGFTNWAPGEPNNSNNEDYGSMRKNDALAQWNDLINVPTGYHANPQGVVEIGTTGTPFCFGDGTGTPCPCGNSGAAGNGCASSVNAAGGNLGVTGNPSLSSDSLALGGSGMTDTNCLYFQGTAQQAGGLGVAFGDGLRCAGGTIVRLKTLLNVAGASQYPQAGDPPVSVRGLVMAPGTRAYQVWYRNAAAFCTPDTFNLTNGVEVTWVL